MCFITWSDKSNEECTKMYKLHHYVCGGRLMLAKYNKIMKSLTRSLQDHYQQLFQLITLPLQFLVWNFLLNLEMKIIPIKILTCPNMSLVETTDESINKDSGSVSVYWDI